MNQLANFVVVGETDATFFLANFNYLTPLKQSGVQQVISMWVDKVGKLSLLKNIYIFIHKET